MHVSPQRRRTVAGLGSLLALALAGLTFPAAHAGQAAGPVHASGQRVGALRDGLWRPDASVRTIAVHGKRIYVAGDFTRVVSSDGHVATRPRIAALNRTTGALIGSFHPHVNGTVDALAVFHRRLYLGGDFMKVNGKSRQHIAAMNMSNGHLVKGWHPKLDGPVNALLHLGDRLYVGGDFTHVGRAKFRRLATFNPEGRIVRGWPVRPSGGAYGPVFALAGSPDHRSVLVGGHFERLNTKRRVNLGSLDLRGRVTQWTPRAACVADCPVRDLAVSRKSVFAGIDGPGGRIRAYQASSGRTRWSVRTNGEVTAVALAGTKLLIGGHFTVAAGEPRPMFAVLDAATGALETRTLAVSGQAYPGVLDIRVIRGVALLGGDFDSIQGQGRLAAIAP